MFFYFYVLSFTCKAHSLEVVFICKCWKPRAITIVDSDIKICGFFISLKNYKLIHNFHNELCK